MFLIKTTSSQTKHANETYAKAGAIVTTSVSSIRTVLSLNAVETMIEQYAAATTEGCRDAIKYTALIGVANGTLWVCFICAYIILTLFGSYLIYSQVRIDGCDPSGSSATWRAR